VAPAAFDFSSRFTWLRIGLALVWLAFGLVAKALNAVPRHRRIVARVVGDRASGPVLTLVAGAEIGLAVWLLWGRALAPCAAAQTLMIAAMNGLELRYARDLLLSPLGMLAANAVLLALAWYLALAGPWAV